MIASLTIFRSLPFLLFEDSHFDSDQAIFGLMAKHLSEFEAFPFFMYGQKYLLALSSYFAAPLFLVFGPSVMALKFPLFVLNVLIAGGLFLLGIKEMKLKPFQAAIGTLFFVLPAPLVSSRLLEAAGGNIEPFLFILLIWFFRNHARAFGVFSGIGFLNRPFILYGWLSLICLDLLKGEVTLKIFKKRMLSFVIAILIVGFCFFFVAPFSANFFGDVFPSTTPRSLQEHWKDVVWIFSKNLPILLGMKSVFLSNYNIESHLAVGNSLFLFFPFFFLILLIAWVFKKHWIQPLVFLRKNPELLFAVYLILTGVFALIGYGLAAPLVRDIMLIRYSLLFLLFPIGAYFAWFKVVHSRKWLYFFVVSFPVLLGFSNFLSSGWLLAEYIHTPPRSSLRNLTEHLLQNRVHVGKAPYWVSYHVSFLSGEQVRLTAPEARIRLYDTLYVNHPEEALIIQENPCSSEQEGYAYFKWFLCPPAVNKKSHKWR